MSKKSENYQKGQKEASSSPFINVVKGVTLDQFQLSAPSAVT